VRHIAHLSRLALSEEELATFGEQLRRIVEYVEQLNEVDTEGVEPTAHPLAATDALREDEPQESLAAEKVLANAPQHAANYFKVPKVLDQETA
jgi:aspartyl-tRNA(Asn)/glutamyl-tRNA(Gln) amidotransferase subunit C